MGLIKQALRGNMPEKIDVVVENRMITVKRDIHVFPTKDYITISDDEELEGGLR